ncbi:MAG: hypothetical protein ABI600_18100 [Luteolibacter sp.]
MNPTPPPPVPANTTPFAKTCAKISMIAGFIAIPAVIVFGVIAMVSALGYQNGQNSLLLPILGGLAGGGIHGLAAVGAIVAIINKGPKGPAWTGLILNGLAVLIVGIITVMTSMA